MPRPAPFIVANPGSGTTLLRMMLDAHSELAIPPETHFITEVIQRAREVRRSEGRKPAPQELTAVLTASRRWADFGLDEAALRERMANDGGETSAKRALRAFYSLYAESQGKPRWGDKTPDYLLAMGRIERTLPEARFVHLLRDGRDVALSRRRWRAKAGAKERSVAEWAGQWQRWIAEGREQGERVEHYLEVRYEDLVTDTEPTLRRVCDFAELDFQPAMLTYHERAGERLRELDHSLPAEDGKGAREAGHRRAKHAMTAAPPQESKVQEWRAEMSETDRAEFESEAGDLLAELGYPVGEEARA
jgi:Sulfotransferase family